MDMRPFKIPDIAQTVFGDYTWHKNRSQKTVFLTFDDGPVVGVTDFVLEELEKHGMKATFFMVGENVRKAGSLARQVRRGGHGIGNHTFHHLNGSTTDSEGYLQDVGHCSDIIHETTGVNTRIFRPPYGRIRCRQKRELKTAYEIVLWDLISWDFLPSMSPEKSLRKLKENTHNGSIILFHDQQKSSQFLRSMLPPYLDHLESLGFTTQTL